MWRRARAPAPVDVWTVEVWKWRVGKGVRGWCEDGCAASAAGAPPWCAKPRLLHAKGEQQSAALLRMHS
eukprot:352331-Chlamydomonas_euryale.AAC.10